MHAGWGEEPSAECLWRAALCTLYLCARCPWCHTLRVHTLPVRSLPMHSLELLFV